MVKQIYIRADGNAQIGAGHIMRTLSIAAQLRCAGYRVTYITADSVMHPVLEKNGFDFYCLETDWKHPEQELPVICSLLREHPALFCMVDSYQITEEYLRRIRRFLPVVYLDDLALQKYSADAIVNYGVCAVEDDYIRMYQKTKTQLWLGLNYVPLRDEFVKAAAPLREIPRHILLTVGGADPVGCGTVILRHLLAEPQLSPFVFHPVVGAMSPILSEVQRLAEQTPGRVILHHQVTRMAELMCDCDLAISAGGSTLYELCACGVPTISFSYADNQHPNVVSFDEKGAIPYAGDFRTNRRSVCEKLAQYLLTARDKKAREAQSKAMRSLVDGNGAKRLSEVMLQAFGTDKQ